MKKLIVALMVLVLSMAVTNMSDAQSRARGGVYGMLNLADLSGDDVDNTDFLIAGGGGAFVSYAVHEVVSLGLTANFSLQGAKDGDGTGRTKLTYVNVAPLFQVSPPVGELSPVRPVFYVGPVFGLEVSCKLDNGVSEDCDTGDVETNSLVVGAMGGASLIIQDRFFFGGAYNLGLTSAAKDPIDAKNNVIHIYAGVSFPIGTGGGM